MEEYRFTDLRKNTIQIIHKESYWAQYSSDNTHSLAFT